MFLFGKTSPHLFYNDNNKIIHFRVILHQTKFIFELLDFQAFFLGGVGVSHTIDIGQLGAVYSGPTIKYRGWVSIDS